MIETGKKPPASYTAVYKEYGEDGKVPGKAARTAMMKSKLPKATLGDIWKLIDKQKKGYLTEVQFYHTLALVSIAMAGKRVNQYVLADLKDYPELNLDAAAQEDYVPDGLHDSSFKYANLMRMADCEVGAPTSHGTIMKYLLYPVFAKGAEVQVSRRYSDFEMFRQLLVQRFPFRIVPQLPPKKAMVSGDDRFLEERRLGLKQFLDYVGRHPVYYNDEIVEFFMTESAADKFASKFKTKFDAGGEEFSIYPDRNKEAQESKDSQGDTGDILSKLRTMTVLIDGLQKVTISTVKVYKEDAVSTRQYSDTLNLLSETLPGEPFGVDEPEKFGVLLGEMSEATRKLHELIVTASKNEFDTVYKTLKGFSQLSKSYVEVFERRDQLMTQKAEVFKRQHDSYKLQMSGGDGAEKVTEATDMLRLLEERKVFAEYCIFREAKVYKAFCNEMVFALTAKMKNRRKMLQEELKMHDEMQDMVARLENVRF